MLRFDQRSKLETLPGVLNRGRDGTQKDHSPLVVFDNHISVQSGVVYSGFSQQYLHRLLRIGRLPGLKVGQVRLVDKPALDRYLERSREAGDRRFGPK